MLLSLYTLLRTAGFRAGLFAGVICLGDDTITTHGNIRSLDSKDNILKSYYIILVTLHYLRPVVEEPAAL